MDNEVNMKMIVILFSWKKGQSRW